MEHLLCCENEREVIRVQHDPVLVQDERVLKKLLVTEDRYATSFNYFRCFQKEITSNMRQIVVKWMMEVCEEQQCEESVFPQAVNYLDRFLSVVSIRKTQLQLLGSVCMLLASKMRQKDALSPKLLSYYTDRSVTAEEILFHRSSPFADPESSAEGTEDNSACQTPLQAPNLLSFEAASSDLMGCQRANKSWEFLVLSRLKWDMASIVPNDFLEILISRLPTTHKKQMREHAQVFIGLCTFEYKFCSYSPSLVATASVAAAADGLKNAMKRWSNREELLDILQEITGIEADCIQCCMELIEEQILCYSALSGVQPMGKNASPLHEGKVTCNSNSCNSSLQEQPETPTDVQDVIL